MAIKLIENELVPAIDEPVVILCSQDLLDYVVGRWRIGCGGGVECELFLYHYAKGIAIGNRLYYRQY